MDELLEVALVGTAKKRPAPSESGSPAAQMVAQLPGVSPERQLLLAAGATSVLEYAAAPAGATSSSQPPAPPETRPIVSHRVAIMLREQFQRPSAESDLLFEACRILQEHELVLPPELLPDALAVTDATLRAALQPLLGERGRWLGQFDKTWNWATAALTGEEPLTEEELESRWNEGIPAERHFALACMRRTNSEKARKWLGEAWPSEKADSRLELLEIIATAVTEDDIPFLEGLATDRSMPVRVLASELLCKFDHSRLAGQVRVWCDALVSRAEPERSLASKIRKLTKGDCLQLTINPPTEFDPSWKDLGIAEKPPGNLGKRAYWLIELVRRVHPKHWQDKFQSQPAELIAAAKPDDFGHDLIQAWSSAAVWFAATDWVDALWSYWLQGDDKVAKQKNQRRDAALPSLLATASKTHAEELLAEALLRKRLTGLPYRILLGALAKPWSAKFGSGYVQAMRATFVAPERSERFELAETLPTAAVALPATCFAEALADWQLPESDDYYSRHIANQVAKFQDTVHTRSRLRDAIISE
jgi:hypothetical protein